jgi:hypothetical protein
MRALLLITLLVVLSMLTVREFRERQRDAAAATTQAAQGDPASRTIEDFADTHVQDEAEQPPGDTIPQPGARRLVHVPGTASANDDAPDFHALGVANEHLEAYARYNLDLALAFSLAKLAEGEVAGLMAFAHAYQKPGTFTTLNQDM